MAKELADRLSGLQLKTLELCAVKWFFAKNEGLEFLFLRSCFACQSALNYLVELLGWIVGPDCWVGLLAGFDWLRCEIGGSTGNLHA